jgi:hypothetical protein
MRTARRLVKDEAGMTLALAVIMIVLLGVMGAGLLTFVSRDLNTVIEENRGQRAFEVADAGIGAAKVQLGQGVVRTSYDDDPSAPPVDDIQWSAARGGLTLNDLDGDAATSDSVNVKIQYKPETADSPERFLVISEGTYGAAKRKIEAIFEGVVADVGDGGDGLGHPVYYTPSDIQITNNDTTNSNPVFLNQVSLFSKKNIMIQGDTSQAQFVADYSTDGNNGAFRVSGGADELCDWNSEIGPTNCFRSGRSTWNTISRTIQGSRPGFAAEDRICGFTSVSTGCPPGSSIADGVRGFDRTTGPEDGLTGVPNTRPSTDPETPRGQMLTFVHKEPLPDGTYPRNEDGTISYPFPDLSPIAEAFRDNANSCFDFNASTTTCPEPPPNSSWGLVSSNSGTDLNRITFIDAGNRTLTFNPGTGAGSTSGIIVVWCGRLLQNDNFEGIILNLVGNDLTGNTSCDNTTPSLNTSGVPDGKTVGTYVNIGSTAGNNNGTKCACWVYAEGGTTSVAGIELLPGSEATFRPGARWSFQSSVDFFETPPPTSFALRNWRELYE